jgi:hypothetical protein
MNANKSQRVSLNPLLDSIDLTMADVEIAENQARDAGDKAALKAIIEASKHISNAHKHLCDIQNLRDPLSAGLVIPND